MKTKTKPAFESLTAAREHHGIEGRQETWLFMLGAAVVMDATSRGELKDMQTCHMEIAAYFLKLAEMEPRNDVLDFYTKNDVAKVLAKASKDTWHNRVRRWICQSLRKLRPTLLRHS